MHLTRVPDDFPISLGLTQIQLLGQAMEKLTIVTYPRREKALIAALDKRNGQTVWTTNPLDEDTTSHCSPILLYQPATRRLRQFFLNGMDFSRVDQLELDRVVELLNN